jgi:hypothetical protein
MTIYQRLHHLLSSCHISGKKAAIIIMTDGEASDGDMAGDNVILL